MFCPFRWIVSSPFLFPPFLDAETYLYLSFVPPRIRFPPRTASDDDRELTQYSAKDERVLDLTPVERAGSGLLRKSKWPLMAWALFGTALIIADGVLTPAVSVVS